MIAVSQSMNIETKNHAMPRVMTANGNVSSLRTGLRIVFRIPKQAAAMITVQADPWNVMPERSQPPRPSTIAFVAQERRSQRSTGQAQPFTPPIPQGGGGGCRKLRHGALDPPPSGLVTAAPWPRRGAGPAQGGDVHDVLPQGRERPRRPLRLQHGGAPARP